MSHSEDYTDTGRTRVFYDGMQAGIEKERERIIKLLEPLAEHEDYCKDGCYPEDCSAPSYQFAIALIKGEQK